MVLRTITLGREERKEQRVRNAQRKLTLLLHPLSAVYTLVPLMGSNVYKGGVRCPSSMGTTTEFLSGTSLTLLTWSNVESSRAFPGWIRTRIRGVGGVHWECGPLWNACLAMPGALGSTLDTATVKDRAGEKKTRAMELSPVHN